MAIAAHCDCRHRNGENFAGEAINARRGLHAAPWQQLSQVGGLTYASARDGWTLRCSRAAWPPLDVGKRPQCRQRQARRARLRTDTRGCDGGVRQELATKLWSGNWLLKLSQTVVVCVTLGATKVLLD